MAKRVRKYNAVPIIKGIGDASSGTIAQGDIKLGYYLNNEGNVPLPLYDSVDGTGIPALEIQPGQEIGKVVALGNGPSGLVVAFSGTDAISNAQSLSTKIANFFTQYLPGDIEEVLVANFSDLQQVVYQDQITIQETAAKTASENNPSWLQEASKVALGAAVLIGAIWVAGEFARGSK